MRHSLARWLEGPITLPKHTSPTACSQVSKQRGPRRGRQRRERQSEAGVEGWQAWQTLTGTVQAHPAHCSEGLLLAQGRGQAQGGTAALGRQQTLPPAQENIHFPPAHRHTSGSTPVRRMVSLSTAEMRSSTGVSLKPPRLALQSAVRQALTITTSSPEPARRS
jgi:hypothetical protein